MINPPPTPTPPAPPVTARSIGFGFLFAMLMCAVNSYLTLTFGVIEEGPTIAALFFFAAVTAIRVFFRAYPKASTTEMVVVATMGSAGGSFGFIANFFAAQAMVGVNWSFGQMVAFLLVTSLIGISAAIVLRQVLVIQDEARPEGERLSWIGGKMVERFIRELAGESDSRQPGILAVLLVAFTFYVIGNESGTGWFPEVKPITFLGLGAIGAAFAFSPFTLGAAALMGMRTCVGFVVGAGILMALAKTGIAPVAARPDKFIWPGIAFLTVTGIAPLILNYRVTIEAFRGLVTFRRSGDASDSPLSSRQTVALAIATLLVNIVVLNLVFGINPILVIVAVVIGGLILNLIAARAAAETYFNPARVMATIMMGLFAMMGGSAASTSLIGGGITTSAGDQGGVMAMDFWYGRRLGVRSRVQFWLQIVTVPVCSIIASAISLWIIQTYAMTLDNDKLAAPIAKTWAAAALLFDPVQNQSLPAHAVTSMVVFGIAGAIYAALEQNAKLRAVLPGSIGIGLGLILPVFYSLPFFFWAVVTALVFKRGFKLSEATLGTLAIAGIMGEGVGGLLTAFLRIAGIIV